MKATRALSERAVSFLQEQFLAPTPRNYALGFFFLGGTLPALNAAVREIIDGRVRISQQQADELYSRFVTSAMSQVEVSAEGGAEVGPDALRHQTLRLADLAAAAQATTGEFNRELAFTLGDFAVADLPTLRELLIATLAQSQRSERELAATTEQVEQLRSKLEIAVGDAERDALTGLPNRRGIETHLARTCGNNDPHVIAMCDIDRFKSYNDRYGHAVGDRVLRTVASSLLESLGENFVGRWGGEEFLLVIRSDIATAQETVDDARRALGERHFRLRETDEPLGRITFSAGLTALPADKQHIDSAMERADALLYQAKNRGRDCVVTDEGAGA
ncbi:GGDEF domain-containing protein [Sphingomonas sp. TX0543]|uniref:GGDEF domain-containing protein n=1 Tax=unclassified Sphingomonas TaxID=196159 RepID=UPI0010F70F37|nr:GGDEF domain-containing protein [Sphingomonas sp. 3P27F8]